MFYILPLLSLSFVLGLIVVLFPLVGLLLYVLSLFGGVWFSSILRWHLLPFLSFYVFYSVFYSQLYCRNIYLRRLRRVVLQEIINSVR